MLCWFLLDRKVIQSYVFFFLIFFLWWFIAGYGIEFPVLYSGTLLFICSMYNSLHLLIPNSQSVPPPRPSPLATTSLFSVHGLPLKPRGCFLQSHVRAQWPGLGGQVTKQSSHCSDHSHHDISCWEMGLVDEPLGSPVCVPEPMLVRMTKPNETWNGNATSITKLMQESCVLVDSRKRWRNTEVWMWMHQGKKKKKKAFDLLSALVRHC